MTDGVSYFELWTSQLGELPVDTFSQIPPEEKFKFGRNVSPATLQSDTT